MADPLALTAIHQPILKIGLVAYIKVTLRETEPQLSNSRRTEMKHLCLNREKGNMVRGKKRFSDEAISRTRRAIVATN